MKLSSTDVKNSVILIRFVTEAMSGAINEIFRYLDFLPVQMTKYSVILLRFVTEAMSMLVNEGETVRVPCTVDRLEGFVLLWKQKVQYCNTVL